MWTDIMILILQLKQYKPIKEHCLKMEVYIPQKISIKEYTYFFVRKPGLSMAKHFRMAKHASETFPKKLLYH